MVACGNGEGNTGGSAGEGGSGGMGGVGGQHPLEGTWEGHLIPFGRMTIEIDDSGEIADIAIPIATRLNVVGGQVEGGPEVFTMTWNTEAGEALAFPFLTDRDQHHAAMLLLYGPIGLAGALERDGSATTNFFESDVVGSWTGYGYAYDQDALDFAQFLPVTVAVNEGTPIGFSVAMPSGTITGSLPDFANLLAFWSGTAAGGARVWLTMSPDKQFLAVQAIPIGYDNLQDLTFFALNRQP